MPLPLTNHLFKIKAENENLVKQIDVLQQELSMMGQNLSILQKQDAFKQLNQSINANESFSEQSGSSTSNLLEINRYLRTQKEQIEEKYESVKLDHQIQKQRFSAAENELDFLRKQAQIYVNEINQLKQSLAKQGKIDEGGQDAESLGLLVNTNRRLKAEIDTLNSENSKYSADLRQLEEEMLNVRASLSSSELRNESILGENVCMKTELTKWKERVDTLLRGSDNGEEWARIKSEMLVNEDKNTELLAEIEEQKMRMGEISKKCEDLEK